jgi:hypothetical protein
MNPSRRQAGISAVFASVHRRRFRVSRRDGALSFPRAFSPQEWDRAPGRDHDPLLAARLRPTLALALVMGLSVAWALLAPSGLHAATILGSVKDHEGEPIRRVHVTLEPQGAAAQAARPPWATTDENGEFRFERVPPGSYLVRAEKKRWASAEKRVFVSDEQADGQLEVRIAMDLTPFQQVLAQVQRGILVYVAIFGLLVLAFNMWVVPEPSKEISAFGWVFIVLSVVVALVKRMWFQAALLALLGTVLGRLIQKVGGKAAARRVRQIEEERRKRAEEQKQHVDKLAALVGKEGITLTDLKACGSASIEGEIVEVRAMAGFLPKRSRIVVTRLEGRMPIVEACPEPETAPDGAQE